MTESFGRITSIPLDVSLHLAAVKSPRYGAVATFIGQVRDNDPDVEGEVVALDYTAHPNAELTLSEIVGRLSRESATAGHDVQIATSHRIGLLGVGDVALVACVASGHRAAAFEVCRDLVECIKAEVPIWKRQLRADGSHQWVGLPEG